MNKAERDRLHKIWKKIDKADRKRLRKIWSERAFEGPNYASSDELDEILRAKLVPLAIELDNHRFHWLAEVIAGFSMGFTKSLNEAFGLTRGKPSSLETLQKDADVLQEYSYGVSYLSIAEITGVDRSTVSNLCEGKEEFVDRRNRALSELLSREMSRTQPDHHKEIIERHSRILRTFLSKQD